MRAFASIAAAAALLGCAASGPASLVEGLPALPLVPTFSWTAPLPDGDTGVLSVDPDDPTLLLAQVIPPGDSADAGSGLRTSLRILQADLPDDFLLASVRPPQRNGIDTSQLADRRIFILVRCDAAGALLIYRPSLRDPADLALPAGVNWDTDDRMLRADAASDLTGGLSQIITASALSEYATDDLPQRVQCGSLFAQDSQ